MRQKAPASGERTALELDSKVKSCSFIDHEIASLREEINSKFRAISQTFSEPQRARPKRRSEGHGLTP
jgi:hypothetical protein